jgi:hypothetical protein
VILDFAGTVSVKRAVVTLETDTKPQHERERWNTRTLVYKRTHKGDPDRTGCFGIQDCMGRVRGYNFDAVIGVGGIGSWPKAERISGKINWIGLGSRKERSTDLRGPVVTFDHFILFEEKGKDFRIIAPILARRMYSTKGLRFLFNFSKPEQAEIARILRTAQTAPPSRGNSHRRSSRCSPRCT